GIRATEGVNFLELDFAGGRDGFFQDVEAAAGQSYSLGFDLRARPDRAISTQDIEVVWNDRVVAVAKPGTDWGSFTATVTGTTGTDRLTIREVSSQAGDGHGALLDNFRLVASGAASAPPAEPRGEDTLAVRVSGDSFKGDPAFALSVNGRVVSASTTVTADRAAGEWDSFVFHGDFGLDGSDRVAITFLNDRYEGSADRDRNLYVDEVVLNGESNGRDESFHQARTDHWDF
ncbi:carbohydrate-binding domain-containing protein, partial [Paracoccus sp. (in: a-proteobacteria)]|uniref:carbohydrate-binding domain-containing protein n=1 Tax=Paracoccus sp. TaxID=267 RepID=UPI0026DFA765